MKKFLAIILAAVMLLPIFTVNSFAAGNDNEVIVFDIKGGSSVKLDPWNNFGWGGWHVNYSDITDFSIERVRNIAASGGALYVVTYKGVGAYGEGIATASFNHDYDNTTPGVIVDLGNDMYQATFSLD